jgi:trigger factor
MRTTIETLNDVELRVAVEVGADAVDRELDIQLRKLRGSARVKGFRAGKAPLDMVKKLYGKQAAADAAMKLIEGSLDAAVDTIDRTLVAQPQVEPAIAEKGEPLTYHLRVEVKPQVAVHGWEGLEISVPPATVDASLVDREIEELRGQQRERIPVEDRGADTGDVVLVDGSGMLDGAPDERLSVSGMEVTIGSSQLIPGFEDQLIGATPGDEREVSVTFPEDYGHDDMAGKPAVFSVTIDGLFSEELPDLDDDFAQDVGFDTVDALRQSIVENLQGKADGERTRKLDDKIVALLLERHTFQAPASMVRGQLEHSARRLVMMMAMQGIPHEKAVEMAQGNQQQLAAEAELAVKRFLFLEALAEAESITIDDDTLEAEIVKRIAQGGDQTGDHYDRDEAREGLRLELLERAALDLVCERANITDAEPEAEAEADDHEHDHDHDHGACDHDHDHDHGAA